MTNRGWLSSGLLFVALAGCDAGVAAPSTCTSDRQCSSAGLVCDETSSTCVECVVALDCADGQACRASRCVDVTSCTSSRMCPGQVCDTTAGICVDCVTAVDCPSGESCEDGVCVTPPATCSSDRECSTMALVCDRTAGRCVECNVDTDCPGTTRCGSDHRCGAVGADAGSMRDVGVPMDAAIGPGNDAGRDADNDAAMAPSDANADAFGLASGGIHFTWMITDPSGPLTCADVGIARVMANLGFVDGTPSMSPSFRCGDGQGTVTGLPFGTVIITGQGNDASGSFVHAGGGGTITLTPGPCDSVVGTSCVRDFVLYFRY